VHRTGVVRGDNGGVVNHRLHGGYPPLHEPAASYHMNMVSAEPYEKDFLSAAISCT
jgi:hypothetical protein